MDLIKKLREVEFKYGDAESSFEFFCKHADKLKLTNISPSNRMVSVREERTPSVSITKKLHWCDFGDEGERKSIIELIKIQYNINFKKAVELLLEWDQQLTANGFTPKVKKEETREIKPPYRGWFFKEARRVAMLPNNKAIFWKLLKQAFRGCSKEEILFGKDLFECGLTLWKERVDNQKTVVPRLLIPERDHNGTPWNAYRYNRERPVKGLFRKNGKRVLFGSHLPTKTEKPVILAEGHTDVLVCRAKGVQAVTTGGSQSPIPKEGLEFLEGRIVHIFYDCDTAGLKGIMQKILQFQKHNKIAKQPIEYRVFWWASSFIDKKTKKMVTLEDLKKLQKDYYKKHNFQPQERDLLENWKLMKNVTVNGGYDFIDFHSEHQGSQKYEGFLNIYR